MSISARTGLLPLEGRAGDLLVLAYGRVLAALLARLDLRPLGEIQVTYPADLPDTT